MRGEIVAIGDELTSGVRLDTNSQWVAQQLGDLGVNVLYHTAVGDELAQMIDVLRVAAGRADVIICTGGLGPTADDLTRDAIARCVDVELVQDDGVLDHIRGIYSKRNRAMPQRNMVQALFPVGSRVIPNPHGTAPGIDMDLANDATHRSRVFALPGVPAEMKEMFADTVAPAITDMIPPENRRVVRHRRIKCFGVGESDLEAMLPDLIRRDHYPRVGITVSKATITLRVTAREPNENACLVVMEPIIATIRNNLGDLVFGEEDDELQHVVGRLLLARGATLATAEHYTGGLLGSWLAAIPEADEIGRGSQLLTSQSARGKEAVMQLAAQLREERTTDFALVVGALEEAANPEEMGRVHFALAADNEIVHRETPDIGHPDIRQARVGKAALDLLRKRLVAGM